MQPHLRKCFEAIQTLDFEDDLSIVAMNSAEGEKVPSRREDEAQGRGGDVAGRGGAHHEEIVPTLVVESLADYNTKPRAEWVTQWPAMTVLGVTATYWTSLTEKAISEGALQAWFDQNVSQLDALTDLVRGKPARATPQDARRTHHHRRASTSTRATSSRTCSSRAAAVLLGAEEILIGPAVELRRRRRRRRARRRVPAGTVAARAPPEGGDLWCKMVQASLPFGYEYLGNQPRLVVTPLTDRCYMTLMGAMHLNLGGAPAGPAGTGKTETTKDLAKGLAMQCVVFNCSDGLDYLAMAKFFKGLASSGAWACFDEFNRIDLEVLSVIAAQILTIQNAIQRGLRRFVFEDSEISLDPRCAVFITMNPATPGDRSSPTI